MGFGPLNNATEKFYELWLAFIFIVICRYWLNHRKSFLNYFIYLWCEFEEFKPKSIRLSESPAFKQRNVTEILKRKIAWRDFPSIPQSNSLDRTEYYFYHFLTLNDFVRVWFVQTIFFCCRLNCPTTSNNFRNEPNPPPNLYKDLKEWATKSM